MNQGQAAPPAQQAAPPAQPAVAAAPPVLPAPPAPVPPAPPAFALGPGHSHTILNFDDPNTSATATKLYNKMIAPLEAKFDGEADNLTVSLASVRDRPRCFNWHRLITVPIDDGTTRNLLTHYGQVALDNTRAHAVSYMNTPTRDAQDNHMFYYFLADLLTNEFRTMVLLYADTYTVTNIPVASALLKQIIILTRVDNPESAPCKPEENGKFQNNIPTSPTRITRSTTYRTTSRFPSQWDLVPPHQKQRPSLTGNGRRPCKLNNSNSLRSPSTPKSH